jgi:hypothetical protein
MSFSRFAIVFCFLANVIPGWASQPARSPKRSGAGAQSTNSVPQATRDPQALTVIQAAIAALGGANAISGVHTWTFQAHMKGRVVNDNATSTVTTQALPVQQIATPGATRMITPMTQSFFVAALLGASLVNELQDQELSIWSMRPVTIDSKQCAVVTFSDPGAVGASLPTQTWYFDISTNLPLKVEFRSPAVIGSSMSPWGAAFVSDYRSVSGVQYPFSIVLLGQGNLPEVITIQSVVPSASEVAPEFNSTAGDIGT